jgi:hypothetical protein
MSRTTVKALWPSKKVKDFEELGNSWGSGPIVWRCLSVKYLKWSDGQWLLSAEKPEGKILWGLGRRTDIPESHAAVMRMTYDRAYVSSEDYARAARDIRQFLRDFPPAGGINHWPRIAEIFEGAKVPAIGFHLTSVSDDPWEGIDWSTTVNVYG